MKHELTIIPAVSIHPTQVNFYYQYHWEPARPRKNDVSGNYFACVREDGTLFECKTPKYDHLLTSDRKANGIVSKTAKKKISKAVDYLLAVTTKKKIVNRITGRIIHMKVAFVTLTLPSAQIHEDKEIIAMCLNQFLIEIKKYHQVKNYIWRAEKQKNGNIHFHILVDRFINYQELRDRWNRIVGKLGYIERYREEQEKWHENGFRVREHLLKTWSYEKQLSAYRRGSKRHWSSPNTTDIHSLKKITDIKSYITKYVTKQPETTEEISEEKTDKAKQTGRIWGCNRELNDLKGARIDVDARTEDELKKLEQDPNVKKFKEDYFTCYYIDWKKLPAMGCNYLFQQLCGYLHAQFGTSYQLETG